MVGGHHSSAFSPSHMESFTMRYCRVIISTETRGPVYKKDFEAQAIFGLLVRLAASELITQGVIREGEHYAAAIIPHYGEASPCATAQLVVDQARASASQPAWLTLGYQADCADIPAQFVTVELRFKESGVIYSQDLPVSSFDYFWENLRSALFQMKVLENGEDHTVNLFIRDDDQANFDRDEAQIAADDGSPLIELVDMSASEPDFPSRSLPDYGPVTAKTVDLVSGVELAAGEKTGLDDVIVLIAQPALESIQAIARQEVQIEQGGVLVGRVFHNTDPEGRFLVEITDHIVAEGASANLVELRYTFDTWLRQHTLLKEQYPGKQIVGWYHTHLIKAQVASDQALGEPHATEFFFSQDDRFMHRQFFGDPWYVAMVLNPSGDAAFFRWFGDKISSNQQYYIIGG
jgi:proteasome lid subunit RPN8/RPN11